MVCTRLQIRRPSRYAATKSTRWPLSMGNTKVETKTETETKSKTLARAAECENHRPFAAPAAAAAAATCATIRPCNQTQRPSIQSNCASCTIAPLLLLIGAPTSGRRCIMYNPVERERRCLHEQRVARAGTREGGTAGIIACELA